MKLAKSPQARNIANMRYRSKAYDRVSFDVRQGMREEYKQAAAERNIGLAELFRRGADEYIVNHPVDKEQNEDESDYYPNETTIHTIEEAEQGINIYGTFDSVSEFMEALNAED